HLPRTDAVLLLAVDPLDLLHEAGSERQRGVEAGGQRPCDRRAEHEAMSGGQRLSGRIAQGAAKKRRLSHHKTPRVILGARWLRRRAKAPASAGLGARTLGLRSS